MGVYVTIERRIKELDDFINERERCLADPESRPEHAVLKGEIAVGMEFSNLLNEINEQLREVIQRSDLTDYLQTQRIHELERMKNKPKEENQGSDGRKQIQRRRIFS